MTAVTDRLFAVFQQLLPTRLLSSAVHWLAHRRWPPLKNALIRLFIRAYRLDLSEAESADPAAYPHFNAFFTRALQANRRPIATNNALASPVDGCLSSFGVIDGDVLIQAKGQHYRLDALLGGRSDLAALFDDGHWMTLYLAPYNYHRVHMPLDGRLREMIYVPGRLFSVNQATARALPQLFTRNERVIALFDTDAGPLAMVLVGALLVGSVDTVWAGRVCPPHRRAAPPILTRYDGSLCLPRGAEMGRFNMGSTVILLSSSGAIDLAERLVPGMTVRMGEAIAEQRPYPR